MSTTATAAGQARSLVILDQRFRFTVDFDRSLAAMIDAGNYDRKDPNITQERFPITGTGIVEFEGCLVLFDQSIGPADAERAIEDVDHVAPWRAAAIEHLLAFGAKFPEEQRRCPIIALGTVVNVCGNRRMAELWTSGAGRCLDLGWWGGGLHTENQYLVVHEVSAT